MYNVTFTVEEFQVLRDMLECSIAEIHSEIIHTDRRDLKALLKDRKQLMVNMLDTVKSMQFAATGD